MSAAPSTAHLVVDLALGEEEAHFLQRKAQIAAELRRGRDLSPKGSLDAPILELIDFLNALDSFYTTSSCSGRISIFQHRVSKTKGGRWLLINHDVCEWADFEDALAQIQTQSSAAGSAVNDAAGDVVLRFEPFILAVECRTLAAASQMLGVAMATGFRESGLNAAQKRFILSVRSSVRLEVPIWTRTGGGRRLVPDDYLRYLLELANAKHAKNIEKIQRFDRAVRDEFGDAATSSLGKQTEEKKPKFYNAFEAAATPSTNQAPSTSKPKAKLTPHALFNRQVRLLEGLDALEKKFERVQKRLNGEPVEEAVDHEKSTKLKPKPSGGTKAVTPKATPAAAVASQSTSTVAAASGPLSTVLFVPRTQLRSVKDACSARRWLDVRYKIMHRSSMPTALATEATKTAGVDQWMSLPLTSEAGAEVRRAIGGHPIHSQPRLLAALLALPTSPAVSVLAGEIQLEALAATPADSKAAASSAASSSSSSSASTSILTPTSPPRPRLLHFLLSHVPATVTPAVLDEILPKKWERLGDDLIIFPSHAFAAAELKPLLTSSTGADGIAPMWLAVLFAFKGVLRIGLAHEVASADVLRSSQVTMVLMGEEPTHPQRSAILARPARERGGWVVHRENGVVYHFDCTKVMFSSGNGTEKARVVQCVREENVAEVFAEEGGETIVDLYAGIGYFTLPLLVHTAPSESHPKSAPSASANSSASPSPSKLRFLHACEWNPHSLEALSLGLALNKVPSTRFALHPGDNRRAELMAELDQVADRISLGLLPSAEDAYLPALRMLKARGGILHVHANIPEHAHASCQRSLEVTLQGLVQSDAVLSGSSKAGWTIRAVRLTLVKNYAPRIGHVVVDVACFPAESTWWTVNEQRRVAAAVTAAAGEKSTSNKSKTRADDLTSPSSAPPITASSTTASSDPALWFPFANTVPIVDGATLTHAAFRAIVEAQAPVVLRGVDIGAEWRSAFTPASLLALASKSSSSSGSNPLVSVHVSPHSSRMDFLNRNYMFKQMKLKEMMERMMRIGRDAPPATSNGSTQRSAEAPTLSAPSASASSSSSSITRDSYFISPHELYYLRSLGGNPKTEIADFRASFPALAKKVAWPRDARGVQLIDEARLFSSVFRVSSPGLQLWTHYDIADNLLLHLHGLKRLVLFPPTAAVGLGLKPDPDSSSSPILDVDQRTSAPGGKTIPGWKEAQASGRQVILLPGDVLFIPPLWMHNVTSLDTKFADGYAQVLHPPSTSAAEPSTGASAHPPVTSASLRACGDICVSLNLFWRELPLAMYPPKDLYGNKDLVAGAKVLQNAAEIAKEMEGMPKVYADFYGQRALAVVSQKMA